MTKKRSPGFSGKNRGVTPSVAAPGVTHLVTPLVKVKVTRAKKVENLVLLNFDRQFIPFYITEPSSFRAA